MDVFKLPKQSLTDYRGNYIGIRDVFVAAENVDAAVKVLNFWYITCKPKDLRVVSDAPSNQQIKKATFNHSIVLRRPGGTGWSFGYDILPNRFEHEDRQ